MNNNDKMEMFLRNKLGAYVKGQVSYYYDPPSLSYCIFVDNLGIRYMYTIGEKEFGEIDYIDLLDDIMTDYTSWLKHHFFEVYV